MSKRFASVLWVCAVSLFAENPPVPAPQLLPGVASRAPLKLEDFLASADKNNPTLQQAAAIVRRGWDLVNAGRPACALCGHPIDPEGHSCPRTNGHRPPEP